LLDAAILREVLSERSELPTDLEFVRELVSRDRLPADEAAEVLREQTVDAVFDLFRWTEGSFSFTARAQPDRGAAPPDLALTVDDVVAEVQGRIEVWDKVIERSGPDDAVVVLSRPGEA